MKKFIAITYLVYIIFWEGLVIGGCSYIVFIKGYSGYWFLLAIFFSTAAYSPQKWAELFYDQTKNN